MVRVAFLVLAFVLTISGAAMHSDGWAQGDTSNPYESLRAKALNMTPEDLGLDVHGGDLVAHGVVMDWTVGSDVVTVVSFATGDASLYFSWGGGVIGGFAHENVQQAAKAFVNSAGTFIEKMQPAQDHSTPRPGLVRFFVVTNRGVITAEAQERDLDEQGHELSSLFHAGQDVVTQLRLITEKQ
jgi:hypothetical protein